MSSGLTGGNTQSNVQYAQILSSEAIVYRPNDA